MADGQPPPPGVVMFDKSKALNFHNSSLTATGRDHVAVNVAVAIGGPPEAPPPIQERRRDSSRFSRFPRLFRRRKRRLSSPDQPSRDAESVSPSPAPVLQPAPPSPSPPVRPYLLDVAVLPDGSSLSSIDASTNSPEKEVYERSLLPKGQGHPMYSPSPLGASVQLGDIGIITQDGFKSFGNLYLPKDQMRFSLDALPTYEVVHQTEKFQEGQTFFIGMEDAKKRTDGAKSTDAIDSFEFRCRQAQGAVLVITSSAQLDTLSPLSMKELKQYLCHHGPRLVADLGSHLGYGESLYVVTGTIKSDSWGIAVHTSPMKKPYDHVVLARRRDKGTGAPANTYGWTIKGSADARYGASQSLDDDGRRAKDQSLFLRGFLITPSATLRNPAQQSGHGGSSDSNPSHGSDSGEPGERKDRSPLQEGKDSPWSDSRPGYSAANTRNHQLHDLPEAHTVVPFPCLRSKNYYPSQRINEMLLQNPNTVLAVTHDDDWRRHMIENRYLDEDCLNTLMECFRSSTYPSIINGVATVVPEVHSELASDPNSSSQPGASQSTPVSSSPGSPRFVFPGQAAGARRKLEEPPKEAKPKDPSSSKTSVRNVFSRARSASAAKPRTPIPPASHLPPQPQPQQPQNHYQRRAEVNIPQSPAQSFAASHSDVGHERRDARLMEPPMTTSSRTGYSSRRDQVPYPSPAESSRVLSPTPSGFPAPPLRPFLEATYQPPPPTSSSTRPRPLPIRPGGIDSESPTLIVTNPSSSPHHHPSPPRTPQSFNALNDSLLLSQPPRRTDSPPPPSYRSISPDHQPSLRANASTGDFQEDYSTQSDYDSAYDGIYPSPPHSDSDQLFREGYSPRQWGSSSRGYLPASQARPFPTAPSSSYTTGDSASGSVSFWSHAPTTLTSSTDSSSQPAPNQPAPNPSSPKSPGFAFPGGRSTARPKVGGRSLLKLIVKKKGGDKEQYGIPSSPVSLPRRPSAIAPSTSTGSSSSGDAPRAQPGLVTPPPSGSGFYTPAMTETSLDYVGEGASEILSTTSNGGPAGPELEAYRDKRMQSEDRRHERMARIRSRIGSYPLDPYDTILLDNDQHTGELLNRLNSTGSPTFFNYGNMPPSAVLDVGCGQGHWVVDAAIAWRGHGTKVTGYDMVDISKVVMPWAVRQGVAENIRFVRGNFLKQRLPFPDNSFDLVRMSCLALAIPADAWIFVFQEIHRVLSVGGRLELIDDAIIFPYGRPRQTIPTEPTLPESAPQLDIRIPSSSMSTFSIYDDSELRNPGLGAMRDEEEDDIYELYQVQEEGEDDVDDTATINGQEIERPRHMRTGTPVTARPWIRERYASSSRSQTRCQTWRKHSATSHDLEALFEHMLAHKFGIHMNPEEFILDLMLDVFGHTREVATMHLSLAPPDISLGDETPRGREDDSHGNSGSANNTPRHAPSPSPARTVRSTGRALKTPLSQSPGLVLFPSTFIPMNRQELEIHTSKHLRMLLSCKKFLVEHAMEATEDEEIDEDSVLEALWEYEGFLRARFNLPPDCPGGADDSPAPSLPESIMMMSSDGQDAMWEYQTELRQRFAWPKGPSSPISPRSQIAEVPSPTQSLAPASPEPGHQGRGRSPAPSTMSHYSRGEMTHVRTFRVYEAIKFDDNMLSQPLS